MNPETLTTFNTLLTRFSSFGFIGVYAVANGNCSVAKPVVLLLH